MRISRLVALFKPPSSPNDFGMDQLRPRVLSSGERRERFGAMGIHIPNKSHGEPVGIIIIISFDG